MLTGAVTGGMAGAAFYGAGRAVSALKESVGNAYRKDASKVNVPSFNTKIVQRPEVKASNQVNVKDVTNYWDNYLGSNQTNINPRTGVIDNDRIFSSDMTRSIRFGSHEMNSMGTTKFHFHQEEWIYDSSTDVMEYFNTLIRIKQ